MSTRGITQEVANSLQSLLDRPENREVLLALEDLRLRGDPLLVILGSESDLEEARHLLILLDNVIERVIVASVHRNPDMIFAVAHLVPKQTVILIIGGMSLQIPAVLRGLLNSFGKRNRIFVYPVGREVGAAISAVTILPGGLADTLELMDRGETEPFFVYRIKQAFVPFTTGEELTHDIQPPAKPPKVIPSPRRKQ